MTHLRYPRLSGLGTNPAAPDDILVRLAAHPAGRHGIALRQGNLADVVVEALLAHGGRDAAEGLHGDRISAAMHRRIAEHPDPEIRTAFADSVREMVALRISMPVNVLEEAYGEPRERLVTAEDANLRAVVASSWSGRPPEVQVELLADREPSVRAAATESPTPGVPPQWRDRCLADPATRTNVARYLPMTLDQAAHLVAIEDRDLRRAVAANPHLTAEIVDLLVEIEDPVVRVGVAHSRHLDAATRDRLYADVVAQRDAGSTEAWVALSWNFPEPGWLRGEPLTVRLGYLDCPQVAFRKVLASCPDLPPEAWQRLDNDSSVAVRRIAARRPETAPEVLERLVRENGDDYNVRPLLVEHPHFPRHRLRTLAEDPNPHARYAALQDRALPLDALRRLAAAPEPWLRRAVARHPNADPALLDRLLTDRGPEIADDAAGNPVLPLARMYRILAEAQL
ncbi:MAG: hypothetical protein J2P15_03860 [Micromonosporaceae bacterium]|nr:hypothetical protein [Micromonosporaceae bacterium]